MEELREILDFGKLKIIHEGKTKEGDTMTVVTRFADTKKNNNGRTYPASLLKREVERVQEKIEKGEFWGMAEHSKTGNQTITNASHIFKKAWFDEKAGEAWAELKIIPTTKGKDLMEMVRQGFSLGLSTRGLGSTSYNGTVLNDYKMLGVDIVGSPSSQGAKFNQSNIFESVGLEEMTEEEKMKHKAMLIQAHHKEALDEAKGGDKMKKSSEEFIQKILKDNYAMTARTSRYDNSLGTNLTFEEWCKDGGEAITRASIAHYVDGLYESVEDALEKMGSPELAVELDVEQKKVTPAQCYTEARIAGIDPAKMAKIINDNLDEQAKAINTGWSAEERWSIYENAKRAGKDLSDSEKRLKVLEEHKVFETDEENLFEEEVKARYKMLKEEGPEIPLNDVRKVMKIQREEKKAEELKQMKIQQIVRENYISGDYIKPKKE